ncbi:unnamed protein product, partial [marine sediment metagenome]
LNDGTVEGLRHKELPIFSIQYHSEASPGPLDNTYLFEKFLEMVRETMVNKHPTKRGKQSEYNKILDAFNGGSKTFQECVNHLVNQGFSSGQAKNAVHVYRKGGGTKATFILSGEHRTRLLDDFDATRKTHTECVDYLRENFGCTYHQATSAVYKYRQEKGLIGR